MINDNITKYPYKYNILVDNENCCHDITHILYRFLTRNKNTFRRCIALKFLMFYFNCETTRIHIYILGESATRLFSGYGFAEMSFWKVVFSASQTTGVGLYIIIHSARIRRRENQRRVSRAVCVWVNLVQSVNVRDRRR